MNFIKLPLSLSAMLSASLLFAAVLQNADPAAAIKDIRTKTDALMQQARTGTRVDWAKHEADVKVMATKALEGVDLAKVPAHQAADWMELAITAEKKEAVPGLYAKFLSHETDKAKRFAVGMSMLRFYAENDQPEEAAKVADSLEPTTKLEAMNLVGNTVSLVAPMIAEKSGPEAGLAFIAKYEAKVPKDPESDQEKRMATMIGSFLSETKIDMLVDGGKQAEAVKLLDQELAKATDDRQKSSLNARKTQLTLVGSPAPALNVDRTLGEWKGLEAYRGKVVILDFFAHWCGPCKASLPDIVAMYSELHPKGVEVFHLTRMYGSYGAERNLTPEQEFEKMKGFKEEHKMSWPILYVDNAAYQNYGVTGIPHLVVLDKDGKVRRLKVGFSKTEFAKLRAEIETMLAQ